jgi:hypothetical protein
MIDEWLLEPAREGVRIYFAPVRWWWRQRIWVKLLVLAGGKM